MDSRDFGDTRQFPLIFHSASNGNWAYDRPYKLFPTGHIYPLAMNAPEYGRGIITDTWFRTINSALNRPRDGIMSRSGPTVQREYLTGRPTIEIYPGARNRRQFHDRILPYDPFRHTYS